MTDEERQLSRRLREADAEIERLRAYANHERSLGAEGPMIELTNLQACFEGACDDIKQRDAEIERLRASLQTVRAENDRAKRQFTNVSNKILDDACRALEPKP